MKNLGKRSLIIFFLASCHMGSLPIVSAKEIIVKSLDEVSALWDSYESRVFFEKSNTYVSLSLKVDKQSRIIKSFDITTEWGKISIPNSILLELDKPRLNTIDISYTPLKPEDPDWAFSVRLFYGAYVPTNDKDRDNFSMVEIGVNKTSLIDVTVFDAKTNSSKLLFENE